MEKLAKLLKLFGIAQDVIAYILETLLIIKKRKEENK